MSARVQILGGILTVAALSTAHLLTDSGLPLGDGVERIVLGRRAVQSVGHVLTGSEAGFFRPSRPLGRRLDRRLGDPIARVALDALEWLGTGGRQYIGFVRQGRQRIYVVGYGSAEGIDSQHVLVPMDASGDYHFEAEYDVESETMVLFWSAAWP